jgi:hemolysin-activating ACP:hemolysin acyltransferase
MKLHPIPYHENRTHELGLVAHLMLLGGDRTDGLMSEQLGRAVQAIAHRQIHIVYDDYGTPCAYLMWAWLTDEVAARVASTGDTSLHPSEWNEGNRFWVVDFACYYNRTRQVTTFLRRRILRAHGAATTLRYDRIKDGAAPRTWQRHGVRSVRSR